MNPKSLAKHEENKLMKIKVHKEFEARWLFFFIPLHLQYNLN